MYAQDEQSTTIDLDRIISTARDAARTEAAAVAAVADSIGESTGRAVEAILTRPGRVVVVGSGTSGTIARRLAHLLSVSGTPAFFIHPMDALHGTMGAVQPGDTLVVFSKGGESDEINQLACMLKSKGVAVIGVGEANGSTLARLADVYVLLHTADGADPQGVLAMGSTLVAAIWADALTRAIMDVKAWTVDQSLDMHPAGAVGRIAKGRSAGAACEEE